MDDLVRYRERALRLRWLADFGTEGELRSEVRRLAAELAAWIVNVEVRKMTGEQLRPVSKGNRWRALRRAWSPRRRGQNPTFGPAATS
jgi:hypothetical protein